MREASETTIPLTTLAREMKVAIPVLWRWILKGQHGMKLGSLRRDPVTGKAGYVVRFIGHTAICRDTDGEHFRIVPGQVNGKPVRINIFGVSGEYGGVLLPGERVVVTDGDAIWDGCELTKNTASWERVKP